LTQWLDSGLQWATLRPTFESELNSTIDNEFVVLIDDLDVFELLTPSITAAKQFVSRIIGKVWQREDSQVTTDPHLCLKHR